MLLVLCPVSPVLSQQVLYNTLRMQSVATPAKLL